MDRFGYIRGVVCTVVALMLLLGPTAVQAKEAMRLRTAESSRIDFEKQGRESTPGKAQRKRYEKGWWQKHSDVTTRFRPEQLVVPGALLLVGALGIGSNSPMHNLKLGVRDGMTQLRNNRYLHFDDFLQYVPIVTYLGLCATNVKAKHTVPERIAVAAVTYIAFAALNNGLKYAIGEQRPDSYSRNSFPSGHTGTAFAGAELIRAEYGWHYGLAAYAMATGVAFMRLYNGRHWLNDVIAGAGVGILSARIGYWLLPLNRKIFRMDRRKAMVTTPIYYPETNALGMACAMSF